MQLGMIGLGRMGANMVQRLMRAGHECVVYDVHPEAVQALVKDGAVGATSLAGLGVEAREAPRAVWLMVPAAIVDQELAAAGPAPRARRHRDRRRQLVLPRRHPPRRRAASRRASTTSTSARAAACGGSSAATAR